VIPKEQQIDYFAKSRRLWGCYVMWVNQIVSSCIVYVWSLSWNIKIVEIL